MKKTVLLLFVAGYVLVASRVPCAVAADASEGFSFTDKVVLAYYYIWFHEDKFAKPLTEGGEKERLDGLTPLVGSYNSWEPAIIEKHMQQMNRALLDALAVSWWYDENPDRTNEILDTIY